MKLRLPKALLSAMAAAVAVATPLATTVGALAVLSPMVSYGASNDNVTISFNGDVYSTGGAMDEHFRVRTPLEVTGDKTINFSWNNQNLGIDSLNLTENSSLTINAKACDAIIINDLQGSGTLNLSQNAANETWGHSIVLRDGDTSTEFTGVINVTKAATPTNFNFTNTTILFLMADTAAAKAEINLGPATTLAVSTGNAQVGGLSGADGAYVISMGNPYKTHSLDTLTDHSGGNSYNDHLTQSNATKYTTNDSTARTLTLKGASTYEYAGAIGSSTYADKLNLTVDMDPAGSQTVSGTVYLNNLTVQAGSLALLGTTTINGAVSVTGGSLALLGTTTLNGSAATDGIVMGPQGLLKLAVRERGEGDGTTAGYLVETPWRIDIQQGGQIRFGDRYEEGQTIYIGDLDFIGTFTADNIGGLYGHQQAAYDDATSIITITDMKLTWAGGDGTWAVSQEDDEIGTSWTGGGQYQNFWDADDAIFAHAGDTITVTGTEDAPIRALSVDVQAATTFTGGALHAADLILGSSLTLTGGHKLIANAITVADNGTGTLTMSGEGTSVSVASISVGTSATLDLSGIDGADWGSFTLGEGGSLTLAEGSTLKLGANSSMALDIGMDATSCGIGGAITAGAGTVVTVNGTFLNSHEADGLAAAQALISYIGAFSGAGTLKFANDLTIQPGVGTQQFSLTIGKADGTLTQNIEFAGSLQFNGGRQNTTGTPGPQTISVLKNGTMKVGSTLNLLRVTAVVDGGSLTVGGDINIGHSTNGSFPARLELKNGSLTVGSIKGQNNQASDATLDLAHANAFVMSGGTLTFTGSSMFGLTANDKRLWVSITGGTITTTATSTNLLGNTSNNLKVDMGGVAFNVAQGKTVVFNRTFNQTGTITKTGTGILELTATPTIGNGVTADYDVQAGTLKLTNATTTANIKALAADAVLAGNGKAVVTAGSTGLSITNQLSDFHGTLEIAAGNVSVGGTGSTLALAGAIIMGSGTGLSIGDDATINLTDWAYTKNADGTYSFTIVSGGTATLDATQVTWSRGGVTLSNGTYANGVYTVGASGKHYVTDNTNFVWGTGNYDAGDASSKDKDGVQFVGTSTVTINGTFTSTDSIISTDATVGIGGDSGTVTFSNLTNNGTLKLTSTGRVSDSSTFATGKEGTLEINWNSGSTLIKDNFVIGFTGDVVVDSGSRVGAGSSGSGNEKTVTYKSLTVNSGGQYAIDGTLNVAGGIRISGTGVGTGDSAGALKVGGWVSGKTFREALINADVTIVGGSASIQAHGQETGKINGLIIGEDAGSSLSFVNGNGTADEKNGLEAQALVNISNVEVQHGTITLTGRAADAEHGVTAVSGSAFQVGTAFTKSGAGTLVLENISSGTKDEAISKVATVNVSGGSLKIKGEMKAGRVNLGPEASATTISATDAATGSTFKKVAFTNATASSNASIAGTDIATLGKMTSFTLEAAADLDISNVNMQDAKIIASQNDTRHTITYGTDVKAVVSTATENDGRQEMRGIPAPGPAGDLEGNNSATLTSTAVQTGGTATGTLTVDIATSLLGGSNAGKTLELNILDNVVLGATLGDVQADFTLILGDVLTALVNSGHDATLKVDGVAVETFTADNIGSAVISTADAGLLHDWYGQSASVVLEVKNIPEPATGTLSVLALAALAARRRRKH